MAQAASANFVTATSDLRSVAFDTNSCIYHLLEMTPWSPLVRYLLERAATGTLRVHIPGIVQLELLVGPIRSGNEREREDVLDLTEKARGVVTHPMTRRVAFGAAEVRAMTNLRVADALVVASASAGRCDAVVGNDAAFRALNDLQNVRLSMVRAERLTLPRYIHLDDYINRPRARRRSRKAHG